MRPSENTPQKIGSCITYARRYSLTAMTGMAQFDDDAAEASNGAVNKVDRKDLDAQKLPPTTTVCGGEPPSLDEVKPADLTPYKVLGDVLDKAGYKDRKPRLRAAQAMLVVALAEKGAVPREEMEIGQLLPAEVEIVASHAKKAKIRSGAGWLKVYGEAHEQVIGANLEKAQEATV